MQDKITILKLIHKKYKDNFRKSTFAITCISASQPNFHSNIWAFWQMYNNTFMLYPTALSFNQDILCQSVVLLLPLHYILDTVPGFLCTHTHSHPNLTYVSQMLQIYPSYNPEKYLKQHILGTWTPTPHHIKRQKRIVLTLNTYAQNQVVDMKENEIILRCFTVRCGSRNL